MIPTLEIERESAHLDAERENLREHWDGSAADGRVYGMLSLMRIAAEHGCIELGHLLFGRAMQRTPAATEAGTDEVT